MKLLPGKYAVKSETADIYRSVYSARRDLSIASEMISLCLERNQDTEASDQEDIEEEALWTAAVVRYVRARNGYGKRSEQRAAWEGLSDMHLDLDAEIRMFRDKMYAHAVGLGESHQVYATVECNFYEKPYVYAVALDGTRVFSLGNDKAKEFLELLSLLVEKLWSLEFFWHKKLISELRDHPLEFLSSSPGFRPNVNVDEKSKLYLKEIKRYKNKE